MKKILITGANSYIGTSFVKWVSQWPEKYSVDTIDMVDGSWNAKDFSKYDSVFHVAGIAHVKETKKNTQLYYKVNRDLAIETAQKAKADGVKQFVFLSSMSVYGIETGIIKKDTKPAPKTNYGKSKMQAEDGIQALGDESFQIAVLRPPMVYGKGCKGNYRRLAKLAVKLPVFPDIKNQRSMVYIDNLCEFIRVVIESSASDLFFPQNEEYVCTSDLVRLIAEVHGKKKHLTKIFNGLINLMKSRVNVIQKIFGIMIYDKSMSYNGFDYIVFDFEKSINITEKCK